MKPMLFAALFSTALLSACAPQPVRVDVSRTIAMDKSYTLDLPLGWIRQFGARGELIASRDGYPVQTILVERHPLASAFQRTKKGASANTLPSELGELALAELKASNEQLAALTVVEHEPILVSGREGFRLRVAYKSQRGLELLRDVVGITDKTTYYQLSYIAPKLYYFAKYQPDFDRTVESFSLAQAK